jgi:hypothetical protein
MLLYTAVVISSLAFGTHAQSTISAWFPILGDGEPWINTDKPMVASIAGIVGFCNESHAPVCTYDDRLVRPQH